MINTMSIIERRAAFDVGSGSTKLQVSEVDMKTGKIVQTFYNSERPQAYGIALQQSADGNLGEEVVRMGIELFLELKAVATEKYQVVKFAAVATEVFRKAKNGMEVLQRLRDATQIEIVLVNQDLEAELGFKSVVAESKQAEVDICVWDSGGASFQITALHEVQLDGVIVLNKYLGTVGTSIALSVLITDVLGRRMEDIGDMKAPGAVNPVPTSAKEGLIRAMTARLPVEVPRWLRGRSVVTAACGNNCLFKVCCDVLSISGTASSDISSFTVDQAEVALDTCLDCTDEQLLCYQQFEFAEGVHVIVCKLALLIAVMRHCEIKTIDTVMCTGSCAGVLESPKYWN